MGMGRVRITGKYQITIPKDVRDLINIVPGEIVEVEALDEHTIIVRRIGVRDPLSHLIGKRRFDRHISIDEVEEAVEESIHR